MLKRLRDSLKGNTAMMFALCALPVSVGVGVSLDWASANNAQRGIRAAQDAATLAAALEYMRPQEANRDRRVAAAREHGANQFAKNLAAAGVAVRDPRIAFDFSERGKVKSVARAKSPNLFAGLVGMHAVPIRTEAEVGMSGSKRFEITLMLDNTSSMFWDGRFDKMRAATKDFVNRMFDMNGSDHVSIAVVPWSTSVNILSEAVASPSDANASFGSVPAAGSRRLPRPARENRRDHVLNPMTNAAFASGAQMNTLFAPTTWRGCIRAAAGERLVSNSGHPVGSLTDAFPGARWPVNWVPPKLHRSKYCDPCSPPPPAPSGPPPPPPPGPPPPPPSPPPRPNWDPNASSPLGDGAILFASDRSGFSNWTLEGKALPYTLAADWHDTDDIACHQDPDGGSANSYIPRLLACSDNSRTPTGTRSACLSDPNEFAYNASGGAFCPELQIGDVIPWDRHKAIAGPNLNCPTAILPLSSNRRQVMEKLDHMYPVPGGTHADVGLMWGLRTLSPRPEWKNFWGYSTTPSGWRSEEVVKVGILLTDGLNSTAPYYEGYYGCVQGNRGTGYDDPATPWMDTADCALAPGIERLDEQAMDRLMANSCDAMKNDYGVTLYTIAVDINDPSAIPRLRDCASSDEHAFSITSGDLDDAFSAIMGSVLRISK